MENLIFTKFVQKSITSISDTWIVHCIHLILKISVEVEGWKGPQLINQIIKYQIFLNILISKTSYVINIPKFKQKILMISIFFPAWVYRYFFYKRQKILTSRVLGVQKTPVEGVKLIFSESFLFTGALH